MTSYNGKSYIWYQMPDVVSVKCPQCGEYCEFSFSSSFSPNKKDRVYFEKSRSFQTEKVMSDKGWKYLAWYDPGLGKKHIDIIQDFPSEINADNFKPSRTYTEHNRTRGVIVCHCCSYRKLHKLSWPEDAYFKIDYKGNLLWAYNREMGNIILEYLSSNDRKKRVVGTVRYLSQHYWLRKIPTVFQTKKAKNEVITKLTKMLS